MQTNKPQTIQRTDGIARKAERRIITGVADSTWDRLEQQGLAPKRVRLGPRNVGWDRRELFAWVEQKLAARIDTWRSLGDVAADVVENVRPR
jgi:predicted DNA-binding transcriptional regulator AlpA